MTPINSDPPPTVFVIDDHHDFRESLVALIEAMGYSAVGFASAGDFHGFYVDQPGCLILDVWLPGQSGPQLYQQLLQEKKRIPAIFVTGHADVETAVEAMKLGAVEFIEKPFDRLTLADRIQKALDLDAEWRRRDAEFRHLHEKLSRLTPADHETLHMLTSGESNKTIAAKLMITRRAVEFRRARLLGRLGVRTVAELLHLTITYQVLDDLRTLSFHPSESTAETPRHG